MSGKNYMLDELKLMSIGLKAFSEGEWVARLKKLRSLFKPVDFFEGQPLPKIERRHRFCPRYEFAQCDKAATKPRGEK